MTGVPSKILGAQENLCTYCCQSFLKLEVEHVIPKMFYTRKTRQKNIDYIKVPVCRTCNELASKVQGAIRTWFALLCSDTNKVADELTRDKVKRGLARGNISRGILAGKIDVVQLKTPSGIVLPKKAARVNFSKQDRQNIETFLGYVVRGVIRDQFDIVLPPDIEMVHYPAFGNFFEKDSSTFDWLSKYGSILKYRQAYAEVFESKSGYIEEVGAGIVISNFYYKLPYLSFFGPQGYRNVLSKKL